MSMDSPSASDTRRPPLGGGVRTRQRVRELVGSAGAEGLSVLQVAEAVGIHPNTARFHLETLARDGALETGTAPAEGRGRPARIFRTAASPAEPAATASETSDGYRLLAEIFAAGIAAEPDAGERAARIGYRWGAQAERKNPGSAARARHPEVGGAVALMDEYGFDPEWEEAPGEEPSIRLRSCPFSSLVREHGDIVCALHGGLLAGALDVARSGLRLERLIPFAAPGVCTAALARSSA